MSCETCKISNDDLIIPNWPVPECVKAFATTRIGGVSQGAFEGFNLAAHVGDNPAHVAKNRQLLCDTLKLPQMPVWLDQTHSALVKNLDDSLDGVNDLDKNIAYDASYTTEPYKICAILTGDCFPVLFCDTKGGVVGACHAGWRGILGGILENTLKAILPHAKGDILAWVGPGIGPKAFEVGQEVSDKFQVNFPNIDIMPNIAITSKRKEEGQPSNRKRFFLDLPTLIKQHLKQLGVVKVDGGGFCTYEDSVRDSGRDNTRFYSYRRDGQTGRQATLIWLRAL